MNTEYRMPEQTELELIEREAQRLRARFIAGGVRSAARSVAALPARIAAMFRRAAHI